MSKAKQPKTPTEDNVEPMTPVKDVIKEKSGKLEKLKKGSVGYVCPSCGKELKTKKGHKIHVSKCTPDKPVINGSRKGDNKGGGRAPDPIKLELKEQKKAMQELIASKTNMLLATQLQMAVGTRHLYKRYEEEVNVGKHKKKVMRSDRVTDEADFLLFVAATQDGQTAKVDGVEYYFIEASSGNHMALMNLLDRGFGKPKENLELSEDPDAPVGQAGTGTTDEMLSQFSSMFREHIRKANEEKYGKGTTAGTGSPNTTG